MKLIVILTTVLLLHGTAVAQDLMVYPAENQSNEQMEKDKFDCYSWAKGQTNFDPTVMPQAATPQAQQKSVAGGAVSGGARGAAVGAGVGAITGGVGKGAARGAMLGGTFGGLRSKSQNKQAKQAQMQSAQTQSAQTSRGKVLMTGLTVRVWKVADTPSSRLAGDWYGISGGSYAVREGIDQRGVCSCGGSACCARCRL